jgi:hypothetical protein
MKMVGMKRDLEGSIHHGDTEDTEKRDDSKRESPFFFLLRGLRVSVVRFSS